jgi:hypothetical protein
LASGCTIEAAASASGAAVRTIKSWLAGLPGFRARFDQLRGEMTAHALGRLISSMTVASKTLAFLCRKAQSETVRLGAARAVLEMAVKMRETVELEERIAKLEAARTTTTRRTA